MKLLKAERKDLGKILEMQREAFADLLEKYRDYDVSPACETPERILEKFLQEETTYYLICLDDGTAAGAVRVTDRQDGSRKRISPIFILKQYRGRGLATEAMAELERLRGKGWKLETILQETGNCRLYERIGYVKTGRTDRINDRMDIVYYEKD